MLWQAGKEGRRYKWLGIREDQKGEGGDEEIWGVEKYLLNVLSW